MFILHSIEYKRGDIMSEFAENEQMSLLDKLLLQLLEKIDELLVFKGAYMLSKILPSSRMTHDIDLSMLTQKEYEKIKPKLADIGEYFIQKDLADGYQVLELVQNKKSGGLRIKNKIGKNIIGVDISVQDLTYGVKKEDIKIAIVDSYCVERMLSDKLYVILSQKRYRRTKDLYDLYNITNFIDIDYALLKECICKRGYDEYLFDNIPFSEEDILKYINSWNKLRVRDVDTGMEKNKPDIGKVLCRLYDFIAPLKFNFDVEHWDSKLSNWV